MTSVNTNAAAITALRTLQSTNQQLESTQSRISTGYKIGEAKDNAAYWAISTTLKSDNKSLSTVKDALGLGSATVDVAYQSLNKTKDVLDEIKSKLVAATQDGVDKTKIQAEIGELQKQLKSIATASNFSGENWLSVDSTDSSYSAVKKVVSGYTRDASGVVSISTVDIDTSAMKLIDRGLNKEGILDGGVSGNSSSGGVQVGVSPANSATQATYVTDTLTIPATTVNTAGSSSTWSVAFKIDGVTKNYSGNFEGATMAGSAMTIDEAGAWIKAKLLGDSTFAGIADVDYATGKFTFKSDTFGSASTFEVSNITINATDKTAQATGAGKSYNAGANAIVTLGTFTAGTSDINLDVNDAITFDVAIDGSTSPARVTINQQLVKNVLPSSNGKIASVNDMKLVLREALRTAGLGNVTVDDTTGTLKLQGGKSSIEVKNVQTNKGTDITAFDMSTATAQTLTSLIAAVNAATAQVITAASTLGAVSSRIEMQKTFVNTLMDTIDKGVSNLIDADMSEESTKLQALQVKSQLGVQALSIANQSAQSVLSLFRS